MHVDSSKVFKCMLSSQATSRLVTDRRRGLGYVHICYKFISMYRLLSFRKTVIREKYLVSRGSSGTQGISHFYYLVPNCNHHSDNRLLHIYIRPPLESNGAVFVINNT